MKLIYISSSQFSGTTLLSFLLNTHSQVATIGHTTGWRYAADDDFRCSCGERIRTCPLFREVALAFSAHGLPFDPTDFGTAFRLSSIERLNQLLTGPIPGFRSTVFERLRDSIVERFPAARDRLRQQEEANRVLMSTVLEHSAANVYVDNSHSPYRLLRLARNVADEIFPIHLIRDPRGVALSMVTNSGFSIDGAIRSWLRHQQNIVRIYSSLDRSLMVQYEALCNSPNEILADVHHWAGLPAEPFAGNFKSTEHHILGNRMRNVSSNIRLDERWRNDLDASSRLKIERYLKRYCDRQPDSPLVRVIDAYLNNTS